MSKIFWLDTETTGLDPVKNDIVQIAGIIVENGNVLEKINIFCKPENLIAVQPEALAVQGRTLEELLTYPSVKDAYVKLIGTMKKYVNPYDKKDKFHLAGQHIQFDIDFLKNFFLKCSDNYFGSWFNYYSLDLFALASLLQAGGYISLQNLKLATICEYCGVPLTNAHDAMADIEATRACFRFLVKKFLKGKGDGEGGLNRI